MASHGIPRAAVREKSTTEAREKELQEIKEYRHLVDEVNLKIDAKEYTPELLQKTAELLKRNPEYYTVWNHRRRIYANEFHDLNADFAAGKLKEEHRISQILDIIQLDLQFLFPLLLKFPKCYWIWNHRLWLLDQSKIQLPSSISRPIWEQELGLVGKMLSRDSRNFHGWGYRRIVVENLESPALDGNSLSRKEYDYTTKMIGINLSNFSAWHNRTKLILRILDEESASDQERQDMLDEELKLIHKALFDPYDQSLWFYHQNLMCVFDPEKADRTMAPRLTNAQRMDYMTSEAEFLEELLEDAADCKWVYQALIELNILKAKVGSNMPTTVKENLHQWLEQLKKLDPLRIGRWQDLEKSLQA